MFGHEYFRLRAGARSCWVLSFIRFCRRTESCFAVAWLRDVFPGQELLGVVQLLEKKRRGADGSTQPSDLLRGISMIHAYSHRDGDCPRSINAQTVSFFRVHGAIVFSVVP